MREVEIRNYLIGNEDIQSKVKAVTFRIAKALIAAVRKYYSFVNDKRIS